jgi:hypothetical protein
MNQSNYSASTVSGTTLRTLTNQIAQQKYKSNQTTARPIKLKHGVRFRKPETALFTFQVYFYRLTFVHLLKLFLPNADWLMRRLLIFSLVFSKWPNLL